MSPINHINRSVTDALTNNSKARSKPDADQKAGETSAPARPAEDKVSISSESLQVRELQTQLDQVPEVDAEKVNAIKQAIARGDYPLDPEKIAANMMNLEKILSDNS